MNGQAKAPINRKKAAVIFVLYATAGAIFLSGAAFSIYSLAAHVSFPVLDYQIHGSIFGAMAAFLGARYFLSVKRLQAEVYKESSRFSLSNFKREKQCRALTKIR